MFRAGEQLLHQRLQLLDRACPEHIRATSEVLQGPHQGEISKHHLGCASGHRFKEAVVEIVVEGHVQHQGMAGIKPGGFLGTGGSGMAEGDAASGLQGLHQLAAFGVMGPEAAHMQEYPLWRCRPPGCRVAKEAGGQAAHGHVQACLYLAQQGWIEGEQHGVVGLTRLISGHGAQGRRAVMEITAGQQARAWPLPHPLERTGAHQERVAVVQQHAAAGPTAAVEAFAQGLDRGLEQPQGSGTIQQLRTSLEQPWLLPERLVGAVVNQADGHGHAAILGAWPWLHHRL